MPLVSKVGRKKVGIRQQMLRSWKAGADPYPRYACLLLPYIITPAHLTGYDVVRISQIHLRSAWALRTKIFSTGI